jgi:eukaryotic-like serine/threonine-protein kinase
MLGSAVSHYRIIEKLGGGGMGVVYRAEDLVLRRQVALKFLPGELTTNKRSLERFLREARAAAALNHPHICTIYEIGEHEGQHFIVMELLEGVTLKHRIAGHVLPKQDAVEFAIQISDALDAAHDKGIIHRDIKPANLFITARGQAKILDFGVAKLMSPDATGSEAADSPTIEATMDQHLTDTGTTVGTVAYMSPEQVRGEELDARTDLFSFGTVLYEMTTGRQAFSGQSTALTYEAILHHAPTSPMRINPETPLKLAEIIEKSLEKDRGLRYQSAGELRADLKRLKRDMDSAELRVTAGWPAAPEKARWNGRKQALVMAVIAVATFAAVFAGRWWWPTRGHSEQPMLQQRSITSNPAENPVYAAAISPDGRYLAYADFTGVFVRLLETGETHSLPVPEGFCFR